MNSLSFSFEMAQHNMKFLLLLPPNFGLAIALRFDPHSYYWDDVISSEIVGGDLPGSTPSVSSSRVRRRFSRSNSYSWEVTLESKAQFSIDIDCEHPDKSRELETFRSR